MSGLLIHKGIKISGPTAPEMADKNFDPEASFEKFASSLKELQSEVSQLSELDEMERTYALRLVEAIKSLQAAADIAIPLHPALLSTYQANAKQAFLVSEAVVVMTDKDGVTISLPLAQFRALEILAVVQDATPALREIISEKRKLAGARVELLEKILKDLKKAGSTLKQSSPDTIESEDRDLIRNSLTLE